MDSAINSPAFLRFEHALFSSNILNLRKSNTARHHVEPFGEGSDFKSDPYDLLIHQNQLWPQIVCLVYFATGVLAYLTPAQI